MPKEGQAVVLPPPDDDDVVVLERESELDALSCESSSPVLVSPVPLEEETLDEVRSERDALRSENARLIVERDGLREELHSRIGYLHYMLGAKEVEIQRLSERLTMVLQAPGEREKGVFQQTVMGGCVIGRGMMALQVENERLSKEVAVLKGQLAKMETRMTEMKTELVKVRGEQEAQKAKNDEVQTELVKIRGEQEAQKAKNETRMNEVQTELQTELVKVRSEQEAQKAKNETRMNEVQTELQTELVKIRSEQEAQKVKNETRMNEIETALVKIRGEQEAQKAKNDEVQTELVKIRGERDAARVQKAKDEKLLVLVLWMSSFNNDVLLAALKETLKKEPQFKDMKCTWNLVSFYAFAKPEDGGVPKIREILENGVESLGLPFGEYMKVRNFTEGPRGYVPAIEYSKPPTLDHVSADLVQPLETLIRIVQRELGIPTSKWL